MGRKNRRLNPVQTRINPEQGVVTRRTLSMISESSEAVVLLGIFCQDHPAIAISPQIFRRVEAQAAVIAANSGESVLGNL